MRMQTIQMKFDADMLKRIDTLAKRSGETRSEFLRRAASERIRRARIDAAESAWLKSYAEDPNNADEYAVDPKQLSWPDWNPKAREKWKGAKSAGTSSKRRTSAARSLSSRAKKA